MELNPTPTRPTHRLYAVTKRAKSEKAFWAPIGAAWAHRDGKGFAIKLELIPVNGAEIVMRLIEDETGDEGDAGE